jgi:hypothetical protein
MVRSFTSINDFFELLIDFFVDGPPAKQAKKGPLATKAPSSANKATNRPAKKTKTT